MPKNKRTDLTEEENDQERQAPQKATYIELKDPYETYRRPYGLLAKAGISTAGMRPRDAWNAVNELRRAEAAAQRQEKEAKKRRKQAKIKPARAENKPKAKEPQKALPAPVQRLALPLPKNKQKAAVPELSERDRERANNNSMFNRGDNTVNSYKQYADEINGWDISLKQKEKLISQLKKKFDERLSIDARYVPWTVSGPAGYNSKKMGGLADRALRTSAEISDWFDKVKENVKRSSKKMDDRRESAKREEAWFHKALQSGWYNRDGKPSPTLVAGGLAGIAPYDPQRFAELYEKYDKHLHFRKNTNAAKLYEMVKKGEYTGLKGPKKLYESDSYNVYQKNIKAGERVFINFPVPPKPQMIWALKKRGWHWNDLENAWSVPVDKYDEKFVKGIEENYEKYL